MLDVGIAQRIGYWELKITGRMRIGVSFCWAVTAGLCPGISPAGSRGNASNRRRSVVEDHHLLPCDNYAHTQWSVSLRIRFVHARLSEGTLGTIQT